MSLISSVDRPSRSAWDVPVATSRSCQPVEQFNKPAQRSLRNLSSLRSCFSRRPLCQSAGATPSSYGANSRHSAIRRSTYRSNTRPDQMGASDDGAHAESAIVAAPPKPYPSPMPWATTAARTAAKLIEPTPRPPPTHRHPQQCHTGSRRDSNNGTSRGDREASGADRSQ